MLVYEGTFSWCSASSGLTELNIAASSNFERVVGLMFLTIMDKQSKLEVHPGSVVFIDTCAKPVINITIQLLSNSLRNPATYFSKLNRIVVYGFSEIFCAIAFGIYLKWDRIGAANFTDKEFNIIFPDKANSFDLSSSGFLNLLVYVSLADHFFI